MKILVIEDDPENIQSARDQFVGHDLTIISTLNDFVQKSSCLYKSDLVLTDNHIPVGDGPYCAHMGADADCEIGAVVLAKCLTLGIPCIIVTDGNGHKDATALLIEELVFSNVSFNHGGYVANNIEGRRKSHTVAYTREESIPKDWLKRVKGSNFVQLYDKLGIKL